MRILLKTIMAGPDGVRHPGVHDVDDDQGRALIDAFAAEPHRADAPAEAGPPETADARPSGNRARARAAR